MPAPVVKPNSAKWVRNSMAAQQDYLAGVQNPRVSWSAATQAGANNWTAGIQAAVANNSFSKGVKNAGDSAWQEGATGKGAQRYVPGVQSGQQAYEQGVQPYLATIAATNLPARGPRGSAQNYQRSATLGAALNAKRLLLMKGSG